MIRNNRVMVGLWGFLWLIVPVAVRAVCPAAPNGTFTSDVSGWSNFATFSGAIGNPPGSNQVGPVAAAGSLTCGDSLSMCLPVNAGDSCVLSAQAYVPIGQPTSGNGYLGYLYFSDAACATLLSSSATAAFPGTTQGSWISGTTAPLVVPAGAQSARIYLNVCAAPNTSMTINWDNVLSSAQQPAAPVAPTPVLDGKGLALLLVALLLGLLMFEFPRAKHKRVRRE